MKKLQKQSSTDSDTGQRPAPVTASASDQAKATKGKMKQPPITSVMGGALPAPKPKPTPKPLREIPADSGMKTTKYNQFIIETIPEGIREFYDSKRAPAEGCWVKNVFVYLAQHYAKDLVCTTFSASERDECSDVGSMGIKGLKNFQLVCKSCKHSVSLTTYAGEPWASVAHCLWAAAEEEWQEGLVATIEKLVNSGADLDELIGNNDDFIGLLKKTGLYVEPKRRARGHSNASAGSRGDAEAEKATAGDGAATTGSSQSSHLGSSAELALIVQDLAQCEEVEGGGVVVPRSTLFRLIEVVETLAKQLVGFEAMEKPTKTVHLNSQVMKTGKPVSPMRTPEKPLPKKGKDERRASYAEALMSNANPLAVKIKSKVSEIFLDEETQDMVTMNLLTLTKGKQRSPSKKQLAELKNVWVRGIAPNPFGKIREQMIGAAIDTGKLFCMEWRGEILQIIMRADYVDEFKEVLSLSGRVSFPGDEVWANEWTKLVRFRGRKVSKIEESIKRANERMMNAARGPVRKLAAEINSMIMNTWRASKGNVIALEKEYAEENPPKSFKQVKLPKEKEVVASADAEKPGETMDIEESDEEGTAASEPAVNDLSEEAEEEEDILPISKATKPNSVAATGERKRGILDIGADDEQPQRRTLLKPTAARLSASQQPSSMKPSIDEGDETHFPATQ